MVGLRKVSSSFSTLQVVDLCLGRKLFIYPLLFVLVWQPTGQLFAALHMGPWTQGKINFKLSNIQCLAPRHSAMRHGQLGMAKKKGSKAECRKKGSGGDLAQNNVWCELVQYHSLYINTGFRSQSHPEPGYLAGAGAVTLARLRLHLEYLFNNSRKLHGT